MKAKEYAKQYQDNPNKKTIASILVGFLRETSELAEIRQISSDLAGIAILREQDNKWRALSRICPDIPENLYEDFIKDDRPDIYQVWKST